MGFSGIFAALLLVFAINSNAAGKEYIRNGDFESPLSGKWQCVECSMQRVSSGTKGSWSVRVTKRNHHWAGLSQDVSLIAGTRYQIRAKVRLLNSPNGRMWYRVESMLEIRFPNGRIDYRLLGRLPYARQDEGWQSLYGDIWMPQGFSSARFYAQVSDAAVDYQMDEVSITDITVDGNWKQKANQRIDRLRKSDAKITVDVTSGRSLDGLELEVNQVKHAFAFGTAVVADRIVGTDTVTKRYQDFFYDNFNWAVLENALKWRMMEWSKNQINWQRAELAVNALRSRGTPIRGHAVYWGVEEFVPKWLNPMSVAQVRSEINTRLNVVSRFKGKLAHWDVNNENLHGKWFEEKTQDPKLLEKMFRGVRSMDANVKMFLNEYNVVSWNEVTSAYVEQAKRLKKANVGLYGIGVQSHIDGSPDIHSYKSRLDALSDAGLPIWITELDVNNKDVTQRANGYEDALRLYFSHPSVEGILLWGFWNKQHWRPNASLVDGDNFQINEAGMRWRKLIKQEWKTWRKFKLTSKTQVFNVRGFHGDYNIYIKRNGKTINLQKFKLSKSGNNSIRITV